MALSDEFNERVERIKGCIAETEEQMNQCKVALTSLRKELQEACCHPGSMVDEEESLCTQGESQFFVSTFKRVIRTCKVCGLQEQCYVSWSEEATFKELKEASNNK